ncbi:MULTISPECIES: Gfo/Idh/MocA family protein [Sphingobacterium]|jgi:predicted dehydrogenase|uniref:Gfo/Idh/MocA family oxidoreductase n=2 Tax=Sphingobacterium TaxID=28453 RepID=A0ACD5BXD4_9SPHI|nr:MULTISPECIES: Gfo/Idh/MocA family oxidoreductase [Sphingobacterium]HAE67041.1 gfo/Idh/MocA family oxidoreductase [Sphingobacterium sp.]MDF2853623.1 oxidoreductase [Sphingobacterium multivorum]OFV18562.1 oxidoreductase [Sphingobacterium sp. HMSC13C05]OJZ13415.1 MAG: oxidoreductase [Sphingobacterium sp. 40-24]QQT43267.1 Gfo/Idh/MocA family oxidoreductase [Sphingobacterium multivorum]
MKRKLRMGMVGGGNDAFIGAVHRIAAFMDGKIELVCGAFSIDPQISKQSGEDLFVAPERVYLNYEEMIEKESLLPEGERMDFVTIVTPNFLHFAPAKLALEKGFDVVVEKPMTVSVEEAKELQETVERTGRTLCLTHTYSGYPMVKQAKAMVKEGHFGKIRKIVVEYPQGWLSRLTEREGNAGAAWRADPKRSGKSLVMGDIGTHAAHLAEYVSGLKIQELCADLTTFVEGRLLDDDGSVLLRFENGAKGVLMASQISAGEENAVRIRIYGEKGGLEWANEDPNNLIIKMLDQPRQLYRTGNAYAAPYTLSSFATHNTRVPAGHPEGLLESFANIYRNFAATVTAKREGQIPTAEQQDFPTVYDGVRGMAFIDTVVKNNEGTEKWTKFVL